MKLVKLAWVLYINKLNLSFLFAKNNETQISSTNKIYLVINLLNLHKY